MLKLHIESRDFYDDDKGEFITVPGLDLTLEHSLYTISKWESRWMKPFLSKTERTDDEMLDYILCMDITGNLKMSNILNITTTDLNRITQYINAKMTATTISDNDKSNSKEIVTSELIYYWMIALQIPLECEHWHINRLITLIKICNIKNSPKKKQNTQAAMAEQRRLNKERRMQHNSTG